MFFFFNMKETLFLFYLFLVIIYINLSFKVMNFPMHVAPP